MISWPMITQATETMRERCLFAISFKDHDGQRAMAQWKCWLMNAQIEEARARSEANIKKKKDS